ncbi:MAG: lipopolysaccharide transport system permease protein [Hyphomicrobiales bacterium]|jgi:ABC-2 type transport system permease protein/lipopolysaccharide transport system permease protein|nr:lipopolysaccharide transport system permease protein [Hyphomicrobiales bacterium]
MTIASEQRDEIARHLASVPNAIEDFIDGLRRWELWGALGWHDIRQRYRRSVIGPFWLTISMGVMVFGLAYVYGAIFSQPLDKYLPYVAVGMIVFGLITSIANDASQVFILASRTILQTRAPLSLYVYQMLWRNLLIFAHNALIYLLIIPFFPVGLGLVSLLALLGLLLVIVMGAFVGVILATLSARFRDVPPIVNSVTQIAFFLTPIFWTPSALKGREEFIYFNPFYYVLEVIRMPLLGEVPPPTVWLVVIGMTILAGVVAVLFFARFRARIAYWV